MTVLPAVSRVMLSACRIGTPLVTSVPSVREKREIELLRVQVAEERRAQLDPIDDGAAAGRASSEFVADNAERRSRRAKSASAVA